MVRGCEKRVVRWQNPDNRYFEEVLFVLRDKAETRGVAERDIVAEATSLLSRATEEGSRRGRRTPYLPLISFLLGAASAAALILPLTLG